VKRSWLGVLKTHFEAGHFRLKIQNNFLNDRLVSAYEFYPAGNKRNHYVHLMVSFKQILVKKAKVRSLLLPITGLQS